MNLNKILSDLNEHKSTNREEALEKYITERLNKSVSSYYAELDSTITQVYKYDSAEVLKKLNKEMEN